MPSSAVRCRFAPSPNGPLHLGHAYSALRNATVAAASGGMLLLRMENIDEARCTPALEAAALNDLRWLGLPWQKEVRRQSEHFGLYRQALQRLAADALIYPCFCTRGDIARATGGRADWPSDPDGSPLYPGTCRALPAAERAVRRAEGRPHAWRLDSVAALAGIGPTLAWDEFGEGAASRSVPARPERWGDAVLQRKDIPTSYHLAVVVDDAAQAITDVVRGLDLLPATGLHRLLQHRLGLPAPRYHHHRLVCDEAGEKLSKSRQAPALATLRAAGMTPRDVAELAAARLGPGSA